VPILQPVKVHWESLSANPLQSTNFVQALPVAAQSTLDQGNAVESCFPTIDQGQISPEQKPSCECGRHIRHLLAGEDRRPGAGSHKSSKCRLEHPVLPGDYLHCIGLYEPASHPRSDGGHILFLLPEMFLQKKIKPELENAVHLVGFALLMVLMVVLIVNDIVNPVVIP